MDRPNPWGHLTEVVTAANTILTAAEAVVLSWEQDGDDHRSLTTVTREALLQIAVRQWRKQYGPIAPSGA